jgi:hypothetical protein
MTILDGKQMFPCLVCMHPCEVKLTKKQKPCLTCHPCGIQVFIRGPAGIKEFNRLLERGNHEGLLARIREMERRCRLTCPQCGCQFWIEPRLVKTSVFDGSLQGFRCPQKNCGAIVAWEKKQ